MNLSIDAGSRHALSAEYELLVACARTRVDEEQAGIIREKCRASIHWATLSAIARRHSLVPLLYRQLAAVAAHEVPADWLGGLKDLYHANAARNVFLHGELERVLGSLNDEGVKAICYKGPLLAIVGYGDLSLRRFVDLDLIIRRQDVERSIAAMVRLGYQPAPLVSAVQQEFLVRTAHEFAMKRDEGRLLVELHTAAVSEQFASEMNAEALSRRAATIHVGKSEALLLSAEDTLLALCVHGSKHLWERLAWVCDVAEWIAAHPALSWTDVMARAEHIGLQRMLLAGLALAGEILDAPLPGAAAAAAASDPAVARMVAQARQIIFRDPPRPRGMISSFRFNFLARPSWRGRWHYLQHVLTPTAADVGARDVPRALQFVYYAARPFRLFRKGEHLH
jgi:hypothetical protein